MQKKSKVCWVLSIICFLLFIGFTIMVKTINVGVIGPKNSQVGFANLNNLVKNGVGLSEVWDKISDVVMIFALVVAVICLSLAIIQVFKRKCVSKMDKQFLVLALCFGIAIVFYFIFELVVVNYRPVLVEGVLEASFPSSHVLIICSILLCAMVVFASYFKNRTIKILVYATGIGLSGFAVIARVLSGLHWVTDIIGGLLLAVAISLSFYGLREVFSKKSNQENEELIKNKDSEEKEKLEEK